MSKKELCYCAFCRSPKRVYKQKRISFFEVIAGGVLSAVLSFAIWGSPDPRGVVFWLILLFVSEFFLQSRWRMSVICGLCGFDPVLYKKTPQKAAEVVQAKLALRKTDPRFLLSKPLQLPTIGASRKTQLEKNLAASLEGHRSTRGALVSRSI